MTCAKHRCDRSNIFETRALWIFIEFRIRSKYALWDGRQVMDCCLMAPSHYLNWYWHFIITASDINLRAISQGAPQPLITKFRLKINQLKFYSNLTEASELKIPEKISYTDHLKQYLKDVMQKLVHKKYCMASKPSNWIRCVVHVKM